MMIGCCPKPLCMSSQKAGMTNKSHTHLACLERFQCLCRQLKRKDFGMKNITLCICILQQLPPLIYRPRDCISGVRVLNTLI
jgi:hypothetical protein